MSYWRNQSQATIRLAVERVRAAGVTDPAELVRLANERIGGDESLVGS